MKRMKKTTRKSGASAAARLARAVAWACIFLGLASVAGFPAAKKRDKQQPFALVAGTVFRDSGFSLPGAEVSLKPVPEGSAKVKVKPVKVVTDPRGEFAIRVPVVPTRYTVSVKAQGFREQSKPVTVSGDERVDVFFQLEAESKK